MLRDEQIAHEVATYNELVPDDGELSATLFLELKSDAELREWLGKLVGIDRCVALVFADGTMIPGEPQDEERLTRDDVTAAVHFLRFRVGANASKIGVEPVKLVVTHPEYSVETVLDAAARAELAADLGASCNRARAWPCAAGSPCSTRRGSWMPATATSCG